MSFRCTSGVAPAAAEIALRACSFRARTARDVNNCDRYADFDPLGFERRRLQHEQCYHHCRLRSDHRAGQDGRGVSREARRVFAPEGQTRALNVVSDRALARWLLG